ncbi:MAG: cupin domain-containing protein [Calditrichaeota bacterium]|nr:cupin domain-containing protein [Calditrichota bacterium]
MTEDKNYNINTDNKYGFLNLIDIPREVASNNPWFNQTLTTVNDAVVRLGIFQGDFHWHKHIEQDEMFLVLEGQLLLDIEGKETVELNQHQGYTVPKGITHRPRSPQKSVVLMIERQGVVPTGD